MTYDTTVTLVVSYSSTTEESGSCLGTDTKGECVGLIIGMVVASVCMVGIGFFFIVLLKKCLLNTESENVMKVDTHEKALSDLEGETNKKVAEPEPVYEDGNE